MNKNSSLTRLRSKSLVIILIGIILVLLSFFCISGSQFTLTQKLFMIVFNVGIAIIAVSLIAYIWDIIGGDPISKTLEWFKRVETLKSKGFKDVGIRKTGTNIFSELYKRIKSADQVDMMGNILWRDWFHDDNFIEILKERLSLEKEFSFRIILLKPFNCINGSNDYESSKILYQRAFDETEHYNSEESIRNKIVNTKADEMNIGINNTLLQLGQIKKDITNNKRIKVYLSHKTYITCSIIRIDNQILVIHYLHKSGGKRTPFLEIIGNETPLFDIYHNEFERVLAISEDWNE